MQISEDLYFKLLQLLEQNPKLSQRMISAELSISLGKVNYCINHLQDEGFLAAVKKLNSDKASSQCYKVTDSGREKKAQMAQLLLAKKEREAKAISAEINLLKTQVSTNKKI